MKKLYKSLFTGLCLSIASISAFAGSDSVTIGMKVSQGNEEEDHPSKGWRIPSFMEKCTIDFQSHRVELSTVEFITTYELWDEEGSTLMVSYASDPEFVNFLSGLSGIYQLRLVGIEHVYIGYLEL